MSKYLLGVNGTTAVLTKDGVKQASNTLKLGSTDTFTFNNIGFDISDISSLKATATTTTLKLNWVSTETSKTSGTTDYVFTNPINQLSSSNITFTDGSKLIIGDNSFSGTTDDSANGSTLIGTTMNDYIYGRGGNDSVNGGDGNDKLEGGAGDDTLLGGEGDDKLYGGDSLTNGTTPVDSGNDTVSYLTAGAGVTVNLAAGTASGGAGADTLSGIENIIGSGNNDILTGSSVANKIDGGAGADLMTGGDGDDTYQLGQGDVIVEVTGEGTDLINATIDYILPAFVENLVLLGAVKGGTGNDLANEITGNSSANVIDGGANTSGVDTMTGGKGNDVYIVNQVGDVVTETGAAASTEGTDSVIATVTGYTLANNVEYLRLANAVADGTGNALVNSITGNSAANIIDGGLLADIMIGRGGNDTYIVDSTGDKVTELAHGGNDEIKSSVSYTAPVNVEKLTLTAAGTATGNDLANTITGTAGADTLKYGATINRAVDMLVGSDGDDTYYVDTSTFSANNGANQFVITDATSDVVTEAAGEGTDTINSAVSFKLPANVENLTLTGGSSLVAQGNSAANHILGNTGSNIINGGGGADFLSGHTAMNADGTATATPTALSSIDSFVFGYDIGDTVEGAAATLTTNLAAADGDTVVDFDSTDLLDFRALFGDTGYTFVGGLTDLSLTAGDGNQVTSDVASGVATVKGFVDDGTIVSGSPDFTITVNLVGGIELAATDFIY
jgi:Ca2+-binding RTX toxin-like protein